MKSINKISRRLNAITQENLLASRRFLKLQTSQVSIWKGIKRYAH